MARNHPTDPDNVYRAYRHKGNERIGHDALSNWDKAASAMSNLEYPISANSIKDYESGKTVPTPDTVLKMAQAYQTPELKWAHCVTNCPLGRHVIAGSPSQVDEGIYHTYFDLMGAFGQIEQIAQELHKIIADDHLSEDENPMLEQVLSVLNEINESTNELKIWAEMKLGRKS